MDKKNKPLPVEEKVLPPYEGDLLGDPSYQELLKNYQQANWQECQSLLLALLKRYPDHPDLLSFKDDFNLRFDFEQKVRIHEQEQNKSKIIHGSKVILLSILAVIALVGLIGFGVWLGMKELAQQQANVKATQINVLSSQITALLQSGQPDRAEEIIQKMRDVDPNNPTYIQLATQTNELISMNVIYDQAHAKFQAGEYAEALTLFQSIQDKVPNYRDVPLMINEAQNQLLMVKSLNEALAAYDQGSWQDAVKGFETAQSLSPDGLDSGEKEKLLNSYLHSIVQMLESSTTTIEDISTAEIYYRHAIAMIPQSKVYQTERENLQKLSSDLLTLKFTQMAKQIVSDPDQSLASVNQAASFINKASNLNPKNPILSSEVDKINQYQAGFQYYLSMEWEQAIQQLTNLVAVDDNYAEGLAKQMLYEAHINKAKNFYRVGLYEEARKEFEAAEALVWNSDNLMDLFMVELDLGDTVGKMNDFQNAASYYKFAVEAVNYPQRAIANPSFVSNLISAIQLYTDGNYKDSFTLFQTTLQNKSVLFTEQEINFSSGKCLAFIAHRYHSNVQVIQERNDLTSQTILTGDGPLYIPVMEK